MQIDQNKYLIKNCPIFHNLPENEIDRIAKRAVFQRADKGVHLATQGELCRSVYVICRGLSRVYMLGRDGEEATIEIRGANDLVGAISAIKEQPFITSAETIQKTDVLVFSCSDFKDLVQSCQSLSLNLLNYLSEKTKKLMASSGQMQLLDLEGKVWHYLQNLKTYFPDGVIHLSHEEIARITGGTRPRISEVLKSFKDRGFIYTSRRKIYLVS